MKVLFETCNYVALHQLRIGDTFLTERKSQKETGLYMVIDSNSGLFNRSSNIIVAVNLESGQPRQFSNNFKVKPVQSTVSFKE